MNSPCRMDAAREQEGAMGSHTGRSCWMALFAVTVVLVSPLRREAFASAVDMIYSFSDPGPYYNFDVYLTWDSAQRATTFTRAFSLVSRQVQLVTWGRSSSGLPKRRSSRFGTPPTALALRSPSRPGVP